MGVLAVIGRASCTPFFSGILNIGMAFFVMSVSIITAMVVLYELKWVVLVSELGLFDL